mmetsp:Transcript_25294/g.54972  ORF Transcript_25294/g.54972 Transcript_25294/m.54972 type:complete len:404 (-) Transcript_25294:245-1456(-)|eukprot:CAMPEP_0202903768 /NCGR_PEP_ID=MMETSP1392-20130828/26166_1 /ASSEMBLY_ACC=CAM_ASM_000868 /TAXON_ID=225041 /ORGANISM="Chlamydomonas chlamydogama, Strain SAG 11-48b" /LENGTH=403 /DNA_ID=CAMNT_0049591093 /DNA_START=97 /DNA_END=1308 /DNA_ORIENTATION=-
MVEVQGNPVKKFLIKQFLPIGFVIGVVVALVWPTPGDYLYHIMVPSHDPADKPWKLMSTLHICIIFFNFGVTLETSELKTAFKSWQVLLMGFTMILFGTAVTGFIPLHMNFQPEAFGIGLAIFAACPTSLSQGVTVVIQSYGNSALALLLVVTTNLVGIVSTPMWVKILLGGGDVKLDAVDLLVKLIVSILCPLVVGKGLRELVPFVRAFAAKYKVPLYMWTNFQVIMIVWETMSSSRHELLKREVGEIIGAILAAILQHMFFLVLSTIIAWFSSFIFRMKDAERKAFIIMSAQKSLPTAVVIISYLNGLDQGLTAIPCIVFYVLQLFIDSFIGSSWAGKYEKIDELRQKYAAELAELAKMDPEDAPAASDTSKPTHVTSSRTELASPDGEDTVSLLANQDPR